MEENKLKKAKQNNKTLKLLGKISVVVIILLLSLISFAGIYVKDKNAMKNVIPEYKLGTDLYGARNILVKVDDSTTTKKYDSNGNLVENSSEKDENNENITEVEEKVNPDELRTAENYETVKNIIEARLKYMNVEDYLLRFDESTGNISLEVPENSSTDYIAQYTITKGEFKIVDNDTSEVLLSNADLKEAKVQYSTSTSGTTVYLTIEFNKDAVEKLKNISNTYISSTDAEGKTTTKKVKMTLDDSTIISTYFQEEISTGIIQLSMGTSTNTSEIQSNIQSASNMAVLLNTDPMPLTYTMETNRFVYSDITAETLKIVIVGLCIVALIMAICMVIKFKKNGLMGVIADIGFTAVLLLAIRYGNVEISLAGIFAIAIAVIVEYIVTGLILNEYSKKYEKEILIKNIKHLMGRIAICLVPFVVMAVTFALISWEEIASIGMILFWAIIIMIIYNTLMLVLKIFESNNENEKNKKESNHDSKKADNK
jgi:preprotein translocase subunit SecD